MLDTKLAHAKSRIVLGSREFSLRNFSISLLQIIVATLQMRRENHKHLIGKLGSTKRLSISL